jgi:hypothetical protein
MTTLERPRASFDREGDLRALASARRDRVRFVQLPMSRFLAIDGSEVPGSPDYLQAIGTLYEAAYRLHFMLRARDVRTRVGMLEALYWLPEDTLDANGTTGHSEFMEWRWRLLVGMPDEATEDEIDAACREVQPGPMRERLFLDRRAEGPCAQILHVGAYGDEGPSLRRLHEAIARAGLRPSGPLHEIYLNDPNRVGEDRARTVLRRTVEAA